MHRYYFFPSSTMVAALLLTICAAAVVLVVDADDYTVAEGNKSLLAAVGCFWCGEQAFEQYAPGVVEVVSGYAGGTNDNPTYRNHPGHYEVILIEYDPSKTSYEVLVNYAYRNMDPFNGNGQFCDKGSSYYPAIFYDTEEEQITAEIVLTEILELNPDWNEDDIKAPILERPKFWEAEYYHQDYYIMNPSRYGYYKNACKRTQRLKEVWGEEEYKCYHDEEYECFAAYDPNNNTTIVVDVVGGVATVVNDRGESVEAESNIKNAPAETAALLPPWAIVLVPVLGAVVGIGLVLWFASAAKRRCSSTERKDDGVVVGSVPVITTRRDRPTIS